MTRKILIYINLIFLIICFAPGCDEQPVEIPEFQLPVSDRVVLIEELTGVNCPNCPAGSAKVEELLTLFEGKLVGYGIHGSFLSEPITGSKYDFRTPDGAALENYFAPFLGKPAAVIDRVQFDEEDFWSITTIDLWQSYIQREFEKEVLLNLELNVSYDSNSRQVNVEAITIPVRDIPGDLKLSVMLTESHIVDPQKDQNEILEEFEHNHVLREILSSNINGDLIASDLQEGAVESRNFTFTLPPEDGTWIAENIEIVAFVTQVLPGSEEVLQAAAAHF